MCIEGRGAHLLLTLTLLLDFVFVHFSVYYTDMLVFSIYFILCKYLLLFFNKRDLKLW